MMHERKLLISTPLEENSASLFPFVFRSMVSRTFCDATYLDGWTSINGFNFPTTTRCSRWYRPDWCRADWCRPYWCRLINAGPIDAHALLMPIPIDAQLDRLMPDPINAGPIHVLDKMQLYCEALLRPGPIDARPSWCQLSTTYACPDWCQAWLMPVPI